MTTPKKAARRNLPHDTSYRFLHAFATGGIENGCPCDNCGKLLSQVAVVESAEGKQYQVGMDCAATLVTVDPQEFEPAEHLFREAKKTRGYLIKDRKSYGDAYAVVVAKLHFKGQEPYVLIEGYLRYLPGTPRLAALLYGRRFSSRFSVENFERCVKPLLGDLIPDEVLGGLVSYEARVLELCQGDRDYFTALHAKPLSERYL